MIIWYIIYLYQIKNNLLYFYVMYTSCTHQWALGGNGFLLSQVFKLFLFKIIVFLGLIKPSLCYIAPKISRKSIRKTNKTIHKPGWLEKPLDNHKFSLEKHTNKTIENDKSLVKQSFSAASPPSSSSLAGCIFAAFFFFYFFFLTSQPSDFRACLLSIL